MILLMAAPTLVIYVAILLTMVYAYRESKQAVELSMTQLASSQY
jgi:hypothetical protein